VCEMLALLYNAIYKQEKPKLLLKNKTAFIILYQ